MTAARLMTYTLNNRERYAMAKPDAPPGGREKQ